MPDHPPLSLARIAELMISSTDAIVAEVRALGPLSSQAPAPGEWSAKEVLGHLIEADRRGFVGRIRLIVAQERPVFEPWDQPAVAAARRDAERDADTLIAEFQSERRAGLDFVLGLGPAEWSRTGVHRVVGELSVSDLLHEWVHHDREHLAQVTAVTRAQVWPCMGNARRFSDPDA